MNPVLSQNVHAVVHKKDNNGRTALHWAVGRGQCKMARNLIKKHNMDPQDRDKVCGVEG